MAVAYIFLHDDPEDLSLPEGVTVRRHPSIPPGEVVLVDKEPKRTVYDADPVAIGLWLNHGHPAMRGTT